MRSIDIFDRVFLIALIFLITLIALIVLIALPLPPPLFTSFLIYIALCIGILWAAALATALATTLATALAAASLMTNVSHRVMTVHLVMTESC